ncbi:anthranilate synthase component I family protein [Lachnospiraceae bacterium 64-25]
MIQPELKTLKELQQENKYKSAPVSMEILSDIRTPIEVLKILKNVSSHCYLLESISDHEKWGCYTFLGYDPSLEITCQNGQMKVGALSFETSDPGNYIKQVIEEHKSPHFSYLPPFTGGLVGYFSYDYLKYAEPSLKLDAADTEGFRDVDLMLFDKVIAFDNFRQKIILIVNIDLARVDTEYNRAVLELNQLSNRLEAGFEGSLLNTYRVLRTLNPSPYMFYFSSSDMEVAGASPETLVKLENGVLHTFPLAGTRPRGKTPEEDQALEEELLADLKELAEHNMLVDLGRNDIGKISKFGTVEVEKYLCVEKYSHVMHIGSTVRGEIREDKDALSAIDAILPAGTLSGAPKIKACQLINDLENNKRGIYGGAIGYLDFTGNLDTCIAIRIAYKKNGKVFVRSGAGIVADSVPEKEYQECLNKAAAVVNALKTAKEIDP